MKFISNFQANFYIIVAISTLMGLVVGSFLNIVIVRYLIILETEWRRKCQRHLNFPLEPKLKFNFLIFCSHCLQSKKPIKIIHNIPLVRYFLFRGRCVNCYKKIKTYYILVEFLSAVRFYCDSLSNYLAFASFSLIYIAINRTFLLIFTSNSYRIASPYPHCGLDSF